MPLNNLPFEVQGSVYLIASLWNLTKQQAYLRYLRETNVSEVSV